MATKRIRDLTTGTPAPGDFLAVDPANGSTYKVPVNYFTPARSDYIDFKAADWNTITTPGVYSVGAGGSGGANQPPATYPYGLLLVFKSAYVGPGITQIYIPHVSDADPGIYIRQSWGGTANDWYVWKAIGAYYGSNSNGSYLRFANGTQFCWATHMDSSYGPLTTVEDRDYLFRTKIWVFPAIFISPPIVIHSGDVAGARVKTLTVYNISSTQCTLEAGQYKTTSVEIGSSHTIAIGRWK